MYTIHRMYTSVSFEVARRLLKHQDTTNIKSLAKEIMFLYAMVAEISNPEMCRFLC